MAVPTLVAVWADAVSFGSGALGCDFLPIFRPSVSVAKALVHGMVFPLVICQREDDFCLVPAVKPWNDIFVEPEIFAYLGHCPVRFRHPDGHHLTIQGLEGIVEHFLQHRARQPSLRSRSGRKLDDAMMREPVVVDDAGD